MGGGSVVIGTRLGTGPITKVATAHLHLPLTDNLQSAVQLDCAANCLQPTCNPLYAYHTYNTLFCRDHIFTDPSQLEEAYSVHVHNVYVHENTFHVQTHVKTQIHVHTLIMQPLNLKEKQ